MAEPKGSTIQMPTIELPKEQLEQIDNLAADIERADREIAALKKLGIGVAALEDRLNWAKEVRTTLLTEFGTQTPKAK